MNLKALAASTAIAAVMVAGVGGGVASAATAGAAASSGGSSCTGSGADDGWPAVVQGRPDRFDAGDHGGVYVWHDASGWHLRVTHATDDKAVFTGTISARGTVSNVESVQLEKNDKLKVGKSDHVISFRFVNYGHIDGVDWTAPCAKALHFRFKRGGQKLTDTVFLGDKKVHPRHDPFALKRGV